MKTKIRRRFEEDGVRALVCAAACGADLLALEAASDLGVRRRIVLPFDVEAFRERSVVDRPGGGWGELYDRFVQEVQREGNLRLLGLDVKGENVFERANEAILDEAASLAKEDAADCEALVVWDSRLRSGHDYTEHFVQLAERRGIRVKSIPIVDG